MLMLNEDISEGKGQVDRVKEALVATGNYTPGVLFPELFESSDVVDDGSDEARSAISKATANGGGVEYDYSDVDWLSPGENEDELNELMALQEAIASSSSVSLRGNEQDGWV